MQRNRGQKALYEVMSKTRYRAGRSNKLEPLHQQMYAGALLSENSEKKETGLKKGLRHRWNKPNPIQVFAGRIEISISFPTAAIILAGSVLLLILTYRAGYYRAARISEAVASNNLDIGTLVDKKQDVTIGYNSEENILINRRPGNAIVIQAYPLRAHLEPVRLFFKDYGVNTEILKDGDVYILVTADRFEENPNRPGTSGYILKQRIIELGPSYRAPQGRETFAPHYFRDAYAKRFE